MQTSKKQGMCLMNESLTDLVKRKIVDPQEAWSKALDKGALLSQFRKNGIDTSWAQEEAAAPAPA
jgi:twitching motility protein PilT